MDPCTPPIEKESPPVSRRLPKNSSPPKTPEPTHRQLSPDATLQQLQELSTGKQASDSTIYSATPATSASTTATATATATAKASPPTIDPARKAAWIASLAAIVKPASRLPVLAGDNQALVHRLANDLKSFYTGEGDRAVFALNLANICVGGVMGEIKATIQSTMDHVKDDVRAACANAGLGTDRSFGAAQRKKELAELTQIEAEAAASEALSDRSQPFEAWRRLLAPHVEEMVQFGISALYDRNEAESAEDFLRLWRKVQPMFTAGDAVQMYQGFWEGTAFMAYVNGKLIEMGMPRRTDPPAYLCSASRPAQVQQLHERFLTNLKWIASLRHAMAADGTKTFVSIVKPMQETCLETVRAMQKVVLDTINCATLIWPGIGLQTRQQLTQLKRCLGNIQRVQADDVATASAEQSVARVKDILKNYRDAGNAMVLLYCQIVDRAEQAPVPSEPQVMEPEPGPESGTKDVGEDSDHSDRVASDSEDEAVSPASLRASPDSSGPDSDADSDAGKPTQAMALPPGYRPAPRPSVTGRTPAAAAVARTAAFTGQPAPTPELGMIQLYGVASWLNGLFAQGRRANARQISDIADRIASNQFANLNERARQRLLRSLMPHLDHCTHAGRAADAGAAAGAATGSALTYPRLLALFRASAASEDEDLGQAFGALVADNLCIKPDTAAEQVAFNEFLLSGGALELPLQMRGLDPAVAAWVFDRLASRFDMARRSMTPEAFSDALSLRMRGPETPPGKLQVSGARALVGLAKHVETSGSARLISSMAAELHGYPLPEALRNANVTGQALFEYAVGLFKGKSAQLPFKASRSKVIFNPHDVGIAVASALLLAHLDNPSETRPMKITVGGGTHRNLSTKTLPRLILDALASRPQWVGVQTDPSTIVVARADRRPEGSLLVPDDAAGAAAP